MISSRRASFGRGIAYLASLWIGSCRCSDDPAPLRINTAVAEVALPTLAGDRVEAACVGPSGKLYVSLEKGRVLASGSTWRGRLVCGDEFIGVVTRDGLAAIEGEGPIGVSSLRDAPGTGRWFGFSSGLVHVGPEQLTVFRGVGSSTYPLGAKAWRDARRSGRRVLFRCGVGLCEYDIGGTAGPIEVAKKVTAFDVAGSVAVVYIAEGSVAFFENRRRRWLIRFPEAVQVRATEDVVAVTESSGVVVLDARDGARLDAWPGIRDAWPIGSCMLLERGGARESLQLSFKGGIEHVAWARMAKYDQGEFGAINEEHVLGMYVLFESGGASDFLRLRSACRD